MGMDILHVRIAGRHSSRCYARMSNRMILVDSFAPTQARGDVFCLGCLEDGSFFDQEINLCRHIAN